MFGVGRGSRGFDVGGDVFEAAGLGLELPNGGLSFLIKFFLYGQERARVWWEE